MVAFVNAALLYFDTAILKIRPQNRVNAADQAKRELKRKGGDTVDENG